MATTELGLGATTRTNSNPWHIYSSDPTTNQRPSSSPSSSSSSSSVNAISFGFVATAILVSLFLIMAIFEHLFFRPTTPPPEEAAASLEAAGQLQKLMNPQRVPSTGAYGSDLSVLMPGQAYPTYIAQPAPLPVPCQREGICFPPHHI